MIQAHDPQQYGKLFPGCTIHPTATIYENVVMRPGNVIGPGCVIGYPGAIRGKTEFNGAVLIGAGNTFGAGAVVCVGTEGATIIGSNNIIMNLVNVGHNAQIKSGCEIGAGTIIAGWATVEDDAKIKIGARIRNRVTVGKGALVGMGSNVVSDVPAGVRVFGNPARPA